jgi:hypothetical protein
VKNAFHGSVGAFYGFLVFVGQVWKVFAAEVLVQPHGHDHVVLSVVRSVKLLPPKLTVWTSVLVGYAEVEEVKIEYGPEDPNRWFVV